MSEQYVQKKIIQALEQRNFWTCKTITCNKRGVSDILACAPTGKFVAIEVKAEGKLHTVSALQQYQMDAINKIGGVAFAADSVQMVEEKLREYGMDDIKNP